MVLFRIRSFILFIYFSSPTRSPGASFYTLHPAPALSRWRRTEEEGQLKMHPQRQKQGKEEVAAKGCQAVRVGLVPTGMGPNFPARPDYTFPHLIKQNKISTGYRSLVLERTSECDRREEEEEEEEEDDDGGGGREGEVDC
ncbi:hypothetical protein ACLB2K_043843 [Fragaria x ananassa]